VSGSRPLIAARHSLQATSATLNADSLTCNRQTAHNSLEMDGCERLVPVQAAATGYGRTMRIPRRAYSAIGAPVVMISSGPVSWRPRSSIVPWPASGMSAAM